STVTGCNRLRSEQTFLLRRGTEGSNPSPSSGESFANSGNRATQIALVRYYSAFFQDQLQTPHIGSPASHNLLNPCPSLARWNGSKRRRRRAEPSGGIV